MAPTTILTIFPLPGRTGGRLEFRSSPVRERMHRGQGPRLRYRLDSAVRAMIAIFVPARPAGD